MCNHSFLYVLGQYFTYLGGGGLGRASGCSGFCSILTHMRFLTFWGKCMFVSCSCGSLVQKYLE